MVGQFLTTTGEYVVTSVVIGFMPGVLMSQIVTTQGYPESWLCTGCLGSTNRQQRHESSPVSEMSQQRYLYSNRWQTESLHEQSWA